MPITSWILIFISKFISVLSYWQDDKSVLSISVFPDNITLIISTTSSTSTTSSLLILPENELHSSHSSPTWSLSISSWVGL